jgi:hypothetical protein
VSLTFVLAYDSIVVAVTQSVNASDSEYQRILLPMTPKGDTVRSEVSSEDEILLQGAPMVANIVCMPKSEQVRIPTDVTKDARLVAAELYDESLPEYVARVLRAAVQQDMPAAVQKINERIKLPADPSPDKKARRK